MYERDAKHNDAIRTNDPRAMNDYRRLRNRITSDIKIAKNTYFDNVHETCRSNPRRFWSELKTLIPKINFRSIPKSLGAEDFNLYFKSVPEAVHSSFGHDDPVLLWKGNASMHTFTFSRINRNDLLKRLQSLPKKRSLVMI